MRMHHVIIMLTLIFIQGHTDLNHENNKCLIILEMFQAIPIKFAVKIVQLKPKVFIIFASPMTLTFTQGHNCISNHNFLTSSLVIVSDIYLRYGIQTWHDGRHGIYARAHFNDLDISGLTEDKIQC